MLWPYFKQAKENKKKAYLKRDKLFIDGNEFFLPDDDGMETNDGKEKYEKQESGENNAYIGKWNHDQVNEYKDNIDKESISKLLSFIMKKTENVQSVDKNTIDEIVNEIRDVLLNFARNTFGEFVQKTYGYDFMGGKHNHRDWFNTECRRERRAFRKSKRLYKRYGSRMFKERMRHSETLYKKKHG
ncbi:unnamed protein product [Mytilus coruscus]|uniref:Uncharacterized protein n=1 Tax=Mytilus coruscus TaxID=42192 RepID=A0A6J8D309_MYTCO|nr:unnamed protein product [Mytilus coruscus]